jgi:outer membrane protein assembly factor BamB
MSQVDGQLVGRERVDSSGARADLIAQGSRLYLYTNKGQLVAYDLEVSD